MVAPYLHVISCSLCDWEWIGGDDERVAMWAAHMDDVHPDMPGAALLSTMEVETP